MNANLNTSISLVVPAKNEARNLPHVLGSIPSWVDEVVLVDGKSTDDTVAVARSLRPDIKVIDQHGRGKGAALRSGFAACRNELIVMIDADGSMDPGEVHAFVGALLSGADFVKGSRFMQGGNTKDMEWYRWLGNWCFVKLVNLRFGGRFTDLCYGYLAFRRSALNSMSLQDDDGFEIETSMNIQALRNGLTVHEVPSREAARIHGVSNLRTIPDGWRVLKTILRQSFSSGPARPVRDPAPVSSGGGARTARGLRDQATNP